MAELQYSTDALNVRNAFFGAKAIIYVEGEDDILFWEEVFSNVTTSKFEVEDVGGAEELDKRIEKITSGELHGIAARDSDFLDLQNLRISNPKIVYTFGYSIENSLYTKEAIYQLARNWCKAANLTQADCDNWLLNFAANIRPLVELNIANSLSSKGVATIGDNCTRFMTSERSSKCCPTRIATHSAEVGLKIPVLAQAKASAIIGGNSEAVLQHVRGHFLVSAIIKFISAYAKSLGRSISVSADSLYGAALVIFSGSINKSHPHSKHYLTAAAAAWAAI